MNCVAECEYCRSVNVCIDSPNCNTTGHFCTKLNRLVSINKPVDEDCPFYFNKYSYRELINLRDSLISELYKIRVGCCPSLYNRKVTLIVDMEDYYTIIGENNLLIAKVFKGNDITIYYK